MFYSNSADSTQNNNKIPHTPAKSSSTRLLSINKTPVSTAEINMSKSLDTLKKSLKIPNSNTNYKPEPLLTISISGMVGRNIQVISDFLINNYDIENETDKSLIGNIEINVNSKKDPKNNKNFKNILDKYNDDNYDSKFNFTLPLIQQLQQMYDQTPVTKLDQLTFADPKKNQVNEIGNSPSVYELNNNISNHNIDHSKQLIKAKENLCSINKTKSVKVGKAVQKKKLTKMVLPKRVLPSKPVKTNTSDSSENDKSTIKEEESTPKFCVPSKAKKEDKFTRKEKDNKVNNHGLLTNKRNQKEKIGGSSSNDSSYLSARSRKRTADTPITQPITKSPKSDISSKVVANSSQKYSMSESDNSSKTASVNKIKESKSTQETNSRKQILGSEIPSNDSKQFTRKTPRRATEENKETKMKMNSLTSSERNKIQSTATQEKLNK